MQLFQVEKAEAPAAKALFARSTRTATRADDMSEAARALLHYAEHSRGSRHSSDWAYCASCAREWAAHIIGFMA